MTMIEEKNISRRRFMKRGATAAAAVASFNVLPSKDARAVEPITVGLIGCGGRGKSAIKECLGSADEVKIAAVADLFPDNLAKAKEILEEMDSKVPDDRCFTGWDAYKKVMETDVTYVIIDVPPVFRAEMLEAAINAKKHVFMEKPASVDAQGIRRIIAAGEKAKELGLSIAAGTQRRHQGDYIETIKRLHDGAIGEIMAAQAYWCGGPIGFRERQPSWSDVEFQIRNWYHFLWLSGDHIVEQHVHNLDVINWIMGTHPIKAYGCGGCAWQKRGNIWDHHAIDFEYPNGVHMTSLCGQTPRPEGQSWVKESVQGTKGVSNCANWIKGLSEWKYEGHHQNAYIQEHTDLIASIRSGKPINEARNVAESTMTAIMGRMAEYQNKEMTWEEAINSNENLIIQPLELGPNEPTPVAIPGGKEYTGKEGWNPG
ncbi:MAG: Gfo/Idh/MocA family oxidoreductase [Candidatus Omnitrophota bacterium]